MTRKERTEGMMMGLTVAAGFTFVLVLWALIFAPPLTVWMLLAGIPLTALGLIMGAVAGS